MPNLPLPQASYRRSTWKNGLGFTDEISIHPEGSEFKNSDFLWRLSTARIEKSSPFSVFPDHDRILVLVDGPGMRLTHTFDEGVSEEVVDLSLLEPYEFPGDIASRCELESAGVTDFSVFFKKGEVEASVEVLEVADEELAFTPRGRVDFLFVASGTVDVESSRGTTRMQRGDAMKFENSEISFQIRTIDEESTLLNASFDF